MGAGFGGIYTLHKLRNEQGLDAIAIDKAGGVGGTWYWNKYPGALSDSQSFVYQYSFDRNLYTQNKWTHRFIKGPEVLAYLNGVVDRYDLREHIHLETGMTEARWDETSGTWTVETDRGVTYRARFLVTGLGILSATNTPEIHGIEHFEGRVVHSGAWPEELDLTGKRVGVIGNGSTGNQIITATAPIAGHLTVFQRSPQYSVPVRQRAGRPAEQLQAEPRRTSTPIWDQVRNSMVAFGFQESDVECFSVSAEERERIFQEPGTRATASSSCSGRSAISPPTRRPTRKRRSSSGRKIAEIVKDPGDRPQAHPDRPVRTSAAVRRGLLRELQPATTSALSTSRRTRSIRMTPAGHRHRGRHPARTRRARVRHRLRRGRRQLHAGRPARAATGNSSIEHWTDGPTSYLGVATQRVPQYVHDSRPQRPVHQSAADYRSAGGIDHRHHPQGRGHRDRRIDVKPDAESDWTETCREVAAATVFGKVDSWIFGANIPGKKTQRPVLPGWPR